MTIKVEVNDQMESGKEERRGNVFFFSKKKKKKKKNEINEVEVVGCVIVINKNLLVER